MSNNWNKFNKSTSSTEKPKTKVATSSWESFNNSSNTKPVVKQEVSTKPADTTKKRSLGKEILSGVLKTPARLATNAVNAVQIAANKPTTTPFSGDLLGEVKPIGQSGNFGNDLKESLGAGLEMASYLPIAGGLGKVGKIVKGVDKWKNFLKPLAIEGGVSGALGTTGNEIANNARTGEKINPLNIAMGTGVGIVGGPVLGVLGKGLGKVLGKTATEVAPKVADDIIRPVTHIPTPEPVKPPLQLNAPAIRLPGRKTESVVQVQKATKNPVTINPVTGKFQTTYSSSGETINTRTIPDKPVKVNENYAMIPESNAKPVSTSTKLPSTKGDKLTIESRRINADFVQRGIDEIPKEELSKYKSFNEAEQKVKVLDLLDNDPEFRVNVANGKVPKDVVPQIAYNAVKNQAIANNDIELQRLLARNPIATQKSQAASTLRASQVFHEGNDAVDLIARNDKNIIDNIEKKTGKKIDQIQKEEIAKIRESKRIKPQTFKEFIRSEVCKR